MLVASQPEAALASLVAVQPESEVPGWPQDPVPLATQLVLVSVQVAPESSAAGRSQNCSPLPRLYAGTQFLREAEPQTREPAAWAVPEPEEWMQTASQLAVPEPEPADSERELPEEEHREFRASYPATGVVHRAAASEQVEPPPADP